MLIIKIISMSIVIIMMIVKMMTNVGSHDEKIGFDGIIGVRFPCGFIVGDQ